MLKADIRHYFQTVDHQILVDIISKHVKDNDILWLVKLIIDHYHSDVLGKGMPLGNWTSQFFANVYLNELDQFVKHTVKAKYYLRYVDDFVIMHKSKQKLQEYETRIKTFLQSLHLELHPDKCQIVPLGKGINLLGFRVFYHYRIVRKRNLRKIKTRISQRIQDYKEQTISAWDVLDTIQGWSAYSMHGNTFKLRERLQQHVKTTLKLITCDKN